MLLNLKRFCEAGGRPHSSLLSHGALPTMTGVGRRRPRTGQPGTRRRSVNTIPPQGRAVRVTQPQQHGVRQQHRSGSNSQGAPSRGRQGRQGLGRIGRRTSSRASGRGANRPSRTIGERALRTEPNAHQGNAEVVGEHQRSYHRQLCLQTRSPLPSSSPPKRTTRVTRTDTATLTPTRRRFQQTQED